LGGYPKVVDEGFGQILFDAIEGLVLKVFGHRLMPKEQYMQENQ
jgi:hypothetical protein